MSINEIASTLEAAAEKIQEATVVTRQIDDLLGEATTLVRAAIEGGGQGYEETMNYLQGCGQAVDDLRRHTNVTHARIVRHVDWLRGGASG